MLPSGAGGSKSARTNASKRRPSSSSSTGADLLARASKPAYDPQELVSAQQSYGELTAPQEQVNPEMSNLTPETTAWLTGGSAPVEQEQEVAGAKEVLNRALRDQRVAALGKNAERQGPGNIKKRVDPMTRKEYNNLPDLQRAAVDFNTSLVAAVRKDRKLQDSYKPSEEQTATYENAINNMFGKDTDAKMYAPETMAVLRQIDFKDDSARLDDFLNLSAAIKAKDLKHLELNPPTTVRGKGGSPGGGTTYDNPLTGDRVGMTELLARGTLEVQTALEKGNEMLSNYGASVLNNERATDVRLLGGAPTRQATIVGYGNSDLDTWFRQAFETLANNQSDPNTMFQIFQNERTPEERKQFMEYAQDRLLNAVQKGAPIGETAGVSYRNPVEIAKLLGLPGLKRSKQDAPAAAPATTGGSDGYSYGP